MHVTAFAPWLWIAAFAAFVGRAWLELGRLPRPYQPDPKTLGFDWHMAVVAYGLLVAVAAWVLFPVLYGQWRRATRRKLGAGVAPRRWLVGVYAAGWAAVATILLIDPGRYWSWFLD